jgi:lipopolysaccharide/colanic/teichoic acid biosynthesis glycosyltransferase
LPLASWLLLLLLFNQQARRDDLSVTHLGRYFSRRSLDELPQIVNLLKGDMTLVSLAPMLWRIISSAAS